MLDEKTLWYFGNDDLEAALTVVAYSKKKEDNGRTKDLKDLIMEQFDNDVMKFFEWSRSVHNEVSIFRVGRSIESIPTYMVFHHNYVTVQLYNLYSLSVSDTSLIETIKVFESISASVQSDSAVDNNGNNQTPVVEFRATGLKNANGWGKVESFYNPTLGKKLTCVSLSTNKIF